MSLALEVVMSMFLVLFRVLVRVMSLKFIFRVFCFFILFIINIFRLLLRGT